MKEPVRSAAVWALIGAAVVAAVDEIVFHQILNWHHFYDRSTSSVGLLSDGLLHSAELLALVAGVFLHADLRRRADQRPDGRRPHRLLHGRRLPDSYIPLPVAVRDG